MQRWIGCLLAASTLFVPTTAFCEDLTEEQILEKAVQIVVKKVSPCVVRIDTLGDLEEGFRAPTSARDKRKGVLAKKGFKQAYGPSSGLIVSANGYILTSLFTLQRKPRHIFVSLLDGRKFVARVVGKDKSRGLALLKVRSRAPLPTAGVTDKHDIEPGQFSIAIGRGYGAKGPNISVGILSAKNRISGKALQSSALISPANYGGALVGIDGQLQGIIVPLNASGRTAGVDYYDSGIGFAIPMSDVERLLPRLIKGDTLHHGFLGVRADQKKTKGGVMIKEVIRRSPADKVKLKAGDIITEIDGRPVKSFFDFFFSIGGKLAGEEILVKFLRDGVIKEVKAKLAKRPDGHVDVPPAAAPEAPKDPEKGADKDKGTDKDAGKDKDADKDHDHDHDHDHDKEEKK